MLAITTTQQSNKQCQIIVIRVHSYEKSPNIPCIHLCAILSKKTYVEALKINKKECNRNYEEKSNWRHESHSKDYMKNFELKVNLIYYE